MRNTGQRINGSALESIMQEVLDGMQAFTCEACCGTDAATMEIIAVERPADDPCLARILPFSRKSRC